MELSLEEAAAQLGKSARQVRYMIRNKNLPARKVGGRWMVTTDALPRSEGQEQAAARKHAALRDAVEGALSLDKAEARSYSVHQLKAFQAALPIHREASRRLGAALHVPAERLAFEIAFAAATRLYEQGRVSLVKAADLAGMERFGFASRLAELGIATATFDPAEVETAR